MSSIKKWVLTMALAVVIVLLPTSSVSVSAAGNSTFSFMEKSSSNSQLNSINTKTKSYGASFYKVIRTLLLTACGCGILISGFKLALPSAKSRTEGKEKLKYVLVGSVIGFAAISLINYAFSAGSSF